MAPAAAGGIGDFLSPAFGTNCGNHTGTHANGTTTQGTGAANSNLVGLPLGGALNQCGGADIDPDNTLSNVMNGEPCHFQMRGETVDDVVVCESLL